MRRLFPPSTAPLVSRPMMNVANPQIASVAPPSQILSDILDELDIVPGRGQLQALRTKAEVQASDETGMMFPLFLLGGLTNELIQSKSMSAPCR